MSFSFAAVKWPKFLKQYVAAISGSSIILAVSVAYGWTSPSLPILMDESSPLPITADEGSWIVSFMVLGTVVGPLSTVFLTDKIGRKNTLLLAAVPLIIGWLMIWAAQSVEIIYLARFLCGISSGMAYATVPMYLGEIASDSIRGSLGTLTGVMAKAGVLIAYAVGPFVAFATLIWIAIGIAGLFVITFVSSPESPYFFVLKNRPLQASRSLYWLRGADDQYEELKRIEAAVAITKQNKASVGELFNSANSRSLVITIGLGACQQLCGSQAIIAYSQIIFEELSGGMNASAAAIGMGIVQLVTAIFSSSIVDKWGRRPLLLTSTTGAAICNTVIGIFLLLGIDGFNWIPMTALILFIVSYTIGLATVPFAIVSEIFPTNVKALALSAYPMSAAMIGFGVTKLFQVVSDGLGMGWAFLGFAFFSFGFIAFIWYIVPETKGKPLALILEEMRDRRAK